MVAPGQSRAGIAFALVAIALWASIAAVASRSLATLRPLPTLALAFPLGGVVLLAVHVARGGRWREACLAPWRAHAWGLLGLLGYHASLLYAFSLAPGVATNLVNYLWPLCLVLFAGIAEGGLRARAVCGALAGFGGAALAVLTRGAAGTGEGAHPLGYVLAGACAVAWAAFSVALPRTPGARGRMPGFLLLSGLLAAVCVPLDPGSRPGSAALAAAVYMGLGPLGIAFVAWEAALARLSGQALGALAYLTPVASTIALATVSGEGLGTWTLLALALVVGGAAFGASAPRAARRQERR